VAELIQTGLHLLVSDCHYKLVASANFFFKEIDDDDDDDDVMIQSLQDNSPTNQLAVS